MGRRAGTGVALTAVVAAVLTLAPAASPATFSVTRFDDPVPNGCNAGDCSLREAIIAANGNSGADSIPLGAGTYELEVAGTDEDLSADGDLDVNDSLTITGAGIGQTVIDGNGELTGERVMRLDGGTIALSDLTVTDGGDPASTVFGAGISVGDTRATLTRVAVNGNHGQNFGGGVHVGSSGDLTATDGSISDNRLSQSFGSALYNDAGTVTLERMSVTGNEALGFATIYNQLQDAEMVIRDSTVSDNSSEGFGGGLYNQIGAKLTVERSTISGNRAEFSGGGLYLQIDAITTVVNSTISGNRSGGSGGGIFMQIDAETEIDNTTITQNTAQDGGGIHVSGGDVSLTSSILAGNTATFSPNCTGSVGSGGFNIVGDPADCDFAPQASDRTGVDPQLGPLQNNGGPTLTHAPSFSSPALDAGIAGGLASDQRGAPRTFDAINIANAPASDGTDVGAVELLPGGRLALAQCRGVTEN
ncbi:MAG TPA: CSLREA domain-containing protein, partial [Solirubrobacterales bacterium]|nr:CSLREA domain-containing protein [Solirubrobacterales bacterium]